MTRMMKKESIARLYNIIHNRWKTNYEPGSSLVEAAERAAEAVEHLDLKDEEEVQWKNQAGNLVHKSMDVFPVHGT